MQTHNALLPPTACKLANQNELVTVLNHTKLINFTIVSEAEERCEIFLTVSPHLYHICEAFYVWLLPCPIGFVLLSGICNCDPVLLNNSYIVIESCDIDLSAISRPANSWIVHTPANNTTKYLLCNDCPMDYCLPHSLHLNLLNPDLQCQFNRTDILCSQCQHSLSMVFGSSRCVRCTIVHILISIIFIVAGIVLVLLLYLLNLTVTTGTINALIFYANVVSINDSVS